MTGYDFRRFAIASLGALALSATCILSAVGPATGVRIAVR